MEKSDFFDMDRSERIDALEINCVKVKEGHVYQKPLSKEEIDKRNDEINENLQSIEKLKEERKKLTKLISEKNQGIRKNNNEVTQGFMEAIGKIWTVHNSDTKFAELINEDGYIVEKTRLEKGSTMNLFNKQKKIS